MKKNMIFVLAMALCCGLSGCIISLDDTSDSSKIITDISANEENSAQDTQPAGKDE